jgi:uncharacterized protein YndB with AHSA1/START domain
MATITNKISIYAPLARVWEILTNLAELAEYDPTVAAAKLISPTQTGLGAAREVTTKDGKHWFKEKITEFEPGDRLTFELTACNFPLEHLTHTYSFSESGGTTTVTQVMRYRPKYGLMGKLMDSAVIRSNSDKGVKAFFAGLKDHAERRRD